MFTKWFKLDSKTPPFANVSGCTVTLILQAFEPMAKCAVQIIADNGMAEKIKVIPKRSTEIQVGPGEKTVLSL